MKGAGSDIISSIMARRRDAEQFDSADERIALDLVTRLLSTPNGRRFAFILLICAVLVSGGYWLTTRQSHHATMAGPTVRIATWNMHVFAPRPAIRLDTIAGIIHTSNFDVVAMQEIRENGQEVDALLGQLGSPWQRSEFSAISGNHERFVFIFNADHVREVGPAHSIGAADASQFNRIPYEDTFQAGGFTFTLITCHLYYGEGTSGNQRRSHEAQMLSQFARDEVAHLVPDVIVLGDFNEMNGAEGNLHYFRDLGWETLNADTTNLHSKETFDNLLIDPRQTSTWDGTAGSIHFDQTIFNSNDKLAVKSVSDHRPAYADFSTVSGSVAGHQ